MSIKDEIKVKLDEIETEKQRKKGQKEWEKEQNTQIRKKLEEKYLQLLKDLAEIPGIIIKNNQIHFENKPNKVLEIRIQYNYWYFQGSDESPVEKMEGWQIYYCDSKVPINNNVGGYSLIYWESFEKSLANEISRILTQ